MKDSLPAYSTINVGQTSVKTSSIVAMLLLVAVLIVFPATSSAKTTLWMMTHENQAFVDWVTQKTSEYTTLHPDIEFNFTHIAQPEFDQKLAVMMAAGAAPDIVNIYYPTAQEFMRNGFLDKAPAAVVDDLKKNFIPQASVGMDRNGVLYGYPTEVTLILPIINETVYDNNGMTAPVTVDDFLTVQRKMTQFNPDGTMRQQGVNLLSGASTWVINRWAPLLWAYGGRLVDEKGYPAFNTPQGEQATRTYQDLAPLNGLDILKDQAGTITQGAHYRVAALQANPNVRLKAIPAFKGVDGNPVALMYHWGSTVSANSKYKAEAWEFLRWLNSPENRLSLTVACNYPPVTRASIMAYRNDPWMQTFADNFAYGRMLPATPGWPNAQATIISMLHKDALKNRTTPIPEVLANVERSAKAAMGL